MQNIERELTATQKKIVALVKRETNETGTAPASVLEGCDGRAVRHLMGIVIKKAGRGRIKLVA